MKGDTTFRAALLGAVLLCHVGAFVAFGFIPKGHKQTSVAIALAEAKKKATPDKPKEPPKQKIDPKPAAKVPVAPRPEQQVPPPPKAEPTPPPPQATPKIGDAPEAMAGFTDLGSQMGNGVAMPGGGGGGSGGGNGGASKPAAPAPSATVKQVKSLTQADQAPCDEDLVKPKMLTQVQPAYTPEAQQANVEGKVKLEVTIDATGHVTSVRVLNGLGFGLDEAATAAVKQWTFTPAQKCGSAIPTTIKMGVSFGLK